MHTATKPARTRIKRGYARWVLVSVIALMASLAAPGVALADQFRNGYWVYGAIDTEFRRLGFLYPGGPPTVGEPNSPELDAARGGKWQAFGFDTNRILWNGNVSGGKANQLGGLILQKWLTNGDERGRLGYPIVSESPANGGRFNHFENGSIYFRNGTAAAYIVQGEILRYWRESNWENGEFGFPISDEYDFKGGKKQDFQRGSLYWNVNYLEPTNTGQQYPKPVVNSANIPRIAGTTDPDVTVLRAPQGAELPVEPTTPTEAPAQTSSPSAPPTTTSPVPTTTTTTTGSVTTSGCLPTTPSTSTTTSASPTTTTTTPSCVSETAEPTPQRFAPQNRPFPAQQQPGDSIAPECAAGTTAPARRIACSKVDWVLKEYQTRNGRRVEVGSIPFTIEQSAVFGNTTTRTGGANWTLIAKTSPRVGKGTLLGGTTANMSASCPTSKCATVTASIPDMSLTPENVTIKKWTQTAQGLTNRGSINTLTGSLGVTLRNGGSQALWSETDAKLVGRCDSVATRTGCVNTDYVSAITYDPAINENIEDVADHVFDAQRALPGRWGNPDFNLLTRTTNQSIIDANRRKACPANTADDVGSCDEFSLASTYQGASRVATGNYSTRTVRPESNSSQGGIMSTYYTSQRILDGDPFALSAIKDGLSSW